MPKKSKAKSEGKKKGIRHGSYTGSRKYLDALEEAAKDPDENDEVEAIFDLD